MKTILCYGDSNTWGQIPLREFVKKRYPSEIRWTGRLQSALSEKAIIIEEGNNGRTTGPEDPLRAGRNGLSYLPACLDSAAPFDWVILMLGTNDLKFKYQPTPEQISERMRILVKIVKKIAAEQPNPSVQILVIAPPHIKPDHYVSDDFKYPEALSYAKQLAPEYQKMCNEEGIHFLDASQHTEVSDQDGAHLDDNNHALLAAAILNKYEKINKEK